MLITCPKCSSTYKIPSEIKLSEGKKMQCSACHHIFEFHPESRAKVEEKPVLLPPEDAVLSISTKRIVVKAQEAEHTPSQPLPVLPEVFRPVLIQKERSSVPYFWILLCFILLMGFMAMAWMYRDLMTNRALVMPLLTPPKKVENVRPVMPVASPSKAVVSNQGIPATEQPAVPLEVIVPPELDVENPVSEQAPLLSPPEWAPIPVITDAEQPSEGQPEPIDELSLTSEETLSESASQPFLSVQAVRFRKTPTGDAVLIEGILKNLTSQPLPVPQKVYALAYNTKGALVFKKEIYLPSGVLSPNKEQPFFGTYTPAKEDIQWVDVVLEK